MDLKFFFSFFSHPRWHQQKNSGAFLHPWKWCLSHRWFFFNPWYQTAAAALQGLAPKTPDNQRATCPSSSHIPESPPTLRMRPLRGRDPPGWGWVRRQDMTSDRGGTTTATSSTAPPAHSQLCRLQSNPSPTLKQQKTNHMRVRSNWVTSLSPRWQGPALCPPTRTNSGQRLTATVCMLTNTRTPSQWKITNWNVSAIPTTFSTSLACSGSPCAQSSWSRRISAPKGSCSSFRSKRLCCWRLLAAGTRSSGLNCSSLCSTQTRSNGELKLTESYRSILNGHDRFHWAVLNQRFTQWFIEGETYILNLYDKKLFSCEIVITASSIIIKQPITKV